MKIKDAIILFFASLILGWAIAESHPRLAQDDLIQPIKQDTIIVPKDTIKASIQQDTIHDVKDKTALFIGDSHTSNHSAGWQVVLCKKTKLRMNNVSVVGKTTGWMLEQARLNLSSNYDYCFIYGGANDMYTQSITVKQAVNNIKQIVKLCKIHDVKPVILTGFDPIKCTRTSNVNYGPKYAKFQQTLLDSFGTMVVDTRVIEREQCWDNLCHMNPEGHRKTANQIIKVCKFKVY
jgi:lysophospholipase L1-like esterase